MMSLLHNTQQYPSLVTAGSDKHLQDTSLLATAHRYIAQGYSIIPLLGMNDMTNAKRPSIAWKPYQVVRASHQEVDDWACRRLLGGIGIVTGGISRLMVIDFDTAEAWDDFRRCFPQWAQMGATMQVRSAGRTLPHLYFQLPIGMHVRAQSAGGVDLLAEGRYVVAPPTQIGKRRYQLYDATAPQLLHADEIAVIVNWLNGRATSVPHPSPAFNQAASRLRISSQEAAPRLQAAASAFKSRNQALFHVGCQLRDAGWSQVQVRAALLLPFVSLKPKDDTCIEDDDQRRREGERTIASVFRRPPRPQAPTDRQLLPASAREAFLMRKEEAAAQLLDALYLLDAPHVSQNYAITHLGLKPYSVKKALRVLKSYDLLHRIPPSTPDNLIPSSSDEHIPKCMNIGVKKQPKISANEMQAQPRHRGRPQVWYTTPTQEAVCVALGVPYIPSKQTINPEAVCSKRQYRQAHLRQVIEQAPGGYQRHHLARRLGVTRQTLRRDVQAAGIICQPQYVDMPLSWADVDAIEAHAQDWRVHRQEQRPTEPINHTGLFLWIGDKRYPPINGIAAAALARGEQVTLRLQTINHYSLVDVPLDTAPQIPASASAKPAKRAFSSPMLPFSRRKQPLDGALAQEHATYLHERHAQHQAMHAAKTKQQQAALPTEKAPVPEPKPKRNRKTQRQYRKRKRLYQKPLASPPQERRAQAIRAQINPISAAGRGISLPLAREVAHICHWRDVDRALAVTQHLHDSGELEHAAGYFLTLCHYPALARLYKQGEKYGWSRQQTEAAVRERRKHFATLHQKRKPPV